MSRLSELKSDARKGSITEPDTTLSKTNGGLIFTTRRVGCIFMSRRTPTGILITTLNREPPGLGLPTETLLQKTASARRQKHTGGSPLSTTLGKNEIQPNFKYEQLIL